MSKTEFYQAVIVGLGRIGSSYPSDKIPRTHAGAFFESDRVTLAAAVDPDKNARDKFSLKWGNHIPVFSTVKKMLLKIQPDIVSICLPPSTLIDTVSEFLSAPPKLFFLEKPVINEPVNINILLKAINNVPTAVNYHRCWDPAHIHFFEKIQESKEIFLIRIIYSSGMFNYASHIIALLIQYLGRVTKIKKMPINRHNAINSDPSYSFILEFENRFDAAFYGFDDVNYDLLELEALTSDGLLSLKSGGCRIRQEIPENDAFYPDYSQLVDVSYPKQDGPVEGLSQAVENIVQYLDGMQEDLSSDLSLSLNVFDVMWRVKEIQLAERL